MIILWYLAVALVAVAIGLAIAGIEGAAFWLVMGAVILIAFAVHGGGQR